MLQPARGAYSAGGDDVRYVVVRNLQDRVLARSPGSFAYEVADRAISLALNPRRAAKSAAYLERNVLRDARRVLSRSSRRTSTESFAESTPFGRALAAGRYPAMVEATTTPESLVEAADLERLLRARVGALLGPAGLTCLQGLLDGQTVAAMAEEMAVTGRTVERLRARVRAIATPLLKEGA